MRDNLVKYIVFSMIAFFPIYRRVSYVEVVIISGLVALSVCTSFLSTCLEKKRKLPKLFVIGTALSMVLLVLNQYKIESQNVIFQTLFISSFVCFFVTFTEGVNLKIKNTVLNAMAVGCLIQYGFMLSEIYSTNFHLKILKFFYPRMVAEDSFLRINGVTGSLGHSNYVASYLVMGLFSFFRKKWWVFLPFAITALILSQSSMGMVAALAGFLYWAWNNKIGLNGKIPYLLAVVAFGVVFFVGAGGHDSARFEIWKHIIDVSSNTQSVFYGRGPGWFPDFGLHRYGEYVAHEHNEFLSIYNIFGLPALIAFVLFIIWAIPNGNGAGPLTASLFAAFIDFFGHFSLHIPQTAFLFIVVFGLCAAFRIEENSFLTIKYS